MIKQQLFVANPSALLARPVSLLSETLKKFSCEANVIFKESVKSEKAPVFETRNEYFDYSEVARYLQGRWNIYGADLPDDAPKNIYHENARYLLDYSFA